VGKNVTAKGTANCLKMVSDYYYWYTGGRMSSRHQISCLLSGLSCLLLGLSCLLRGLSSKNRGHISQTCLLSCLLSGLSCLSRSISTLRAFALVSGSAIRNLNKQDQLTIAGYSALILKLKGESVICRAGRAKLVNPRSKELSTTRENFMLNR
jgi:hypothetical protein